MTSRRATPAPVAPPNSNQARAEQQQRQAQYSPALANHAPDHAPSSESPAKGKLSFVYRRSPSPNINIQICKRPMSPAKSNHPDPQYTGGSNTPPGSQYNRATHALFSTTTHATPVTPPPGAHQHQQLQRTPHPLQHGQQRRQVYHVISPDLKSPPVLNDATPCYGTQRRVSPAPVSTRDTPIRLNTGSTSPSRIPIHVASDNSARIRQRLVIAPENAPPPSGLSQVTRANLAANLTSAARRRSLSSRSSSRSSLTEDSREVSSIASSNKGVPKSLPIRRVSSGGIQGSFVGHPAISPVNDSRYQEVAPPDSYWKFGHSQSQSPSNSSPTTPTSTRSFSLASPTSSNRGGLVPSSFALVDMNSPTSPVGVASSSSSSNVSPSSTPNKLRGLRYDKVTHEKSGVSSAEKKVDELTNAIEKDMQLNISLPQTNLKSSKVSRYISNGSLNSLSDKSSSSQTSPSSRSDESLVPFPDHISTISQVLNQSRDDGQEEYYGECSICSQGVYGENNACEALENIYHVKCFTCDECGRTLRDKAFYSVNGKVFCEEDYKYSGFQQNNENCAACGHLIMDMQVLQAHNKSYHPSCFRCKACNVPLQSNPFITDKSNRVYCVKDYYRLHSPVCNYCRRTIEPLRDSNETVKVVSRNRDYHVDCFHCHDCNLQLTSEIDKMCYPNEDGSRLYCKKCSLSHEEISSDVQPDEACQLVISTNVPPESPGGVNNTSKITNL